jgi:hypothetical protein
MRYLLLPLVLAACSTQGISNNRSPSEPGSVAFSESPGVEHSVTGTATQSIAPGFEYATTVAVHSDASGRVWGTGTTKIIDLSAFGYTGTGEAEMKPECMRVVGTTAYISFVITRASIRTSRMSATVEFFGCATAGQAKPRRWDTQVRRRSSILPERSAPPRRRRCLQIRSRRAASTFANEFLIAWRQPAAICHPISERLSCVTY